MNRPGLTSIAAASEPDMIAEFLRQEWTAGDRYRTLLLDALASVGEEPTLITDPQTDEDIERRRRVVFGAYRGYGTRRDSYLGTFPDRNVDWTWCDLSPTTLLASTYIAYEFWDVLSGDTRSPVIAAQRIHANDLPASPLYQDARDIFIALAERIRDGLQLPPIMLVTTGAHDPLVVLEGHARITGYALVPDAIPNPVRCLVGQSPDIERWSCYA